MKRPKIPKEVISAQFAMLFIFFIQIRTEFGRPGSLASLLILSLIALAVLCATVGLHLAARMRKSTRIHCSSYNIGARGFYLFYGMYQLIKPIGIFKTFVFGVLNLAHAFCIYLAVALFLNRQAKLYFSSRSHLRPNKSLQPTPPAPLQSPALQSAKIYF